VLNHLRDDWSGLMAHGDKLKDLGPDRARFEVDLSGIDTKKDLLAAAELPSTEHYAEIEAFMLGFSGAADVTISRKTEGDRELILPLLGASTVPYASQQQGDCRGDVNDALSIQASAAVAVTGTIDVIFRKEN
jgi:hypothetical protein